MRIERPHHLHIGLGHLGLGLVLGMIQEDIPLIIMQRISPKWQERRKYLRTGGIVRLVNNVGLDLRATALWTDDFIGDKLQQRVESRESATYLLLYREDNLDKLNWVTHCCSSMTTAVGDQRAIDKWLNGRGAQGGIVIYPFENTVTLTKPTNGNQIREVIPDRICGEDPVFDPVKKCMSIEVESQASVIFKAPENEWKQLFSSAGQVRASSVEADGLFQYYRHRKRLLVNGLHYFVAMFGYHNLIKRKVSIDDWKAQYLTIVIDSILNDRSDIQHCMDVLIGAQAMRLAIEAADLQEPEKSQVFKNGSPEQLYIRLYEDGRDSLVRFKEVTDRLERVLNLNNPEKIFENYREHVAELERFIDNHGWGVDEFPARLKPWAADIKQVARNLTEAGNNVAKVIDIERKKKAAGKIPPKRGAKERVQTNIVSSAVLSKP